MSVIIGSFQGFWPIIVTGSPCRHHLSHLLTVIIYWFSESSILFFLCVAYIGHNRWNPCVINTVSPPSYGNLHEPNSVTLKMKRVHSSTLETVWRKSPEHHHLRKKNKTGQLYISCCVSICQKLEIHAVVILCMLKILYKQYIGLCSDLYNWTCIHDVNFMCLPIAVESFKSKSHIYCHTSCTHSRAELS